MAYGCDSHLIVVVDLFSKRRVHIVIKKFNKLNEESPGRHFAI